MPREKKYTRTIAVRVTAEEWEIIEFAMIRDGFQNPTAVMRKVLENPLDYWREEFEKAAKRALAKTKRDAKKAADADA